MAVMSAWPFFRGDGKSASFRAWLDSVGADVEDLPDDAFRRIEAFR